MLLSTSDIVELSVILYQGHLVPLQMSVVDNPANKLCTCDWVDIINVRNANHSCLSFYMFVSSVFSPLLRHHLSASACLLPFSLSCVSCLVASSSHQLPMLCALFCVCACVTVLIVCFPARCGLVKMLLGLSVLGITALMCGFVESASF